MTERHLFGSSDATDSAGQPWTGRAFEPNAFAGDHGSKPPEFALAVAEWAGSDPASPERAETYTRLMATLPTTRFLIPLVAKAGDEGVTDAGLRVDKTQELSVVNVAGPNGERVLPIFSSVAAMTSWRSDARPVPADGVRCALAAVKDDCQWMVVDPGQPTSFVVRRPALRATARAAAWTSPLTDDHLRAFFAAPVGTIDGVWGVDLEDGDPLARGGDKEVTVRVTLAPGLTRDRVMDVMTKLSDAWTAAVDVTERIDSMQIVVVSGAS